jgi:nucleoside-diphosphate-sugar epimerase
MRVLITGGAGFLGAWITRRLLDGGHEVRVFDRSVDRRVAREILGDAARGAGSARHPPRRADSNSASTACIVVSESSIGQLRTSPPSTYRENLSTWRRYWFTGSYEDVRVSKAPTLVVSPT